MKNLKFSFYLIGVGLTLGTSLIGYGHHAFATKERLEEIAKIDKERTEELKIIMYRMDERIYDMHIKMINHGN